VRPSVFRTGALVLSALAAISIGGCAGSSELEGPRVSTISELTVGPCASLDWPVSGPLSSPFGARWGHRHEGIDLAVAEGTPVHAACDGVVAYAGHRLRGYGNLVILKHAGALSTVYAHNRTLLVREGERVGRGQVIALSGQTGHATAPHVHFEVREDARPVDPLKYLHEPGPAPRLAQGSHPRRAGLSQARHPLQGRHPAHRSRPLVPPLHRPAR
jgi:hypothetical protein